MGLLFRYCWEEDVQMLFNRNIEHSCSYCRFGTALGFGEVICSKRGIMADTGFCSAFKYEPTKRVPEPAPRIMEAGFTAEDFSL